MQIKSLKIRKIVSMVLLIMVTFLCQPVIRGAPIVSPAAQAEKGLRDDYVLFQTVTFGDTNKPLTGFATSGSLTAFKTPNGNMVDYELWTQGRSSPNTNKDKKEFVHGPVRFSRNPISEEVSFSTKGFRLAEDVTNQIMTQVEKNPRVEGTWKQEVSLNLLKSHLPQKLAFHFNVQKIELKPGVQALLIRSYSDVFKIDILPTKTSVNNGQFSGMYKSALVYSPEDHRLYQMTSEFDAGKGDETLQIQETEFLAGLDGKPVFPVLDMRKVLDLQKQDKPDPLVSMPMWAVQALKVQQVVSLASGTTAERTSNDVILGSLLAQLVEFDGFGIDGFPSSASLIEAYGQIHGGQEGELAAQLFSTVAPEALTATGILPKTMLAIEFPLIGEAAAGYAAWSIVADLAGTWLAKDIGKLTPFDWPPRDMLARAEGLFDLTPGPIPGLPPTPPPAPATPKAPKPGAKGGGGPSKTTIVTGAALVVGAVGVVAAKAAANQADAQQSTSGGDCAQYQAFAAKCGTTSGGISVVGFPSPVSCGILPKTRVGDTRGNELGVPTWFLLCN